MFKIVQLYYVSAYILTAIEILFLIELDMKFLKIDTRTIFSCF